ncbi:hypothetical protein [Microvirga tunisiensis]|uniref:Uncharacterized protein n=1 Tax=Microvirga tunisiensis TaxID=2108360 RepID=A0A5N7MAX8_9HYPH|nr:hypothetical protein [Microvirga tunisiensis]MPR06277.1 hypothetical protein [Microvirga tunisiensis]MPR24063.1 hypothetical protein [Microvirga tunisiensis]
MCNWWADRRECDVVEDDLARAKSALIAIRVRLDKHGIEKARACGDALIHVARMLSDGFSIGVSEALAGRGLRAKDLDAAYRDLERSVHRCRTFMVETSPCFEVADDLVNACSLLEHIYRMRFHSMMADPKLRPACEEVAQNLVLLVGTLPRLGAKQTQTVADRGSTRIAARRVAPGSFRYKRDE